MSIKCIDINIICINRVSPGRQPGQEEMNMKIASTISRYLLGVIFLTFGLNGFLNFIHMPPPTGVAAQFFGALFVSKLYVVIFALQVVPAVLLLANRCAPLARTILAAVIVNILSFHVLMAPAGLPLALFVAVLWLVVFIDVRQAFSGLFQSRLQPQA